MQYDWHFERVTPYLSALISGAIVTLHLSFWIVLIGSSIGIGLGVLLQRDGIGALLLNGLLVVLKSIPPLILALFFYYFLTKEVVGISIDAFWTFCIALSLYMAAFTADIVSSALKNIPQSAKDAARSLGFSEFQTWRYISIRHMLREATPGFALLVVTILKTTSLAGIINVREIVYNGQVILSQTARSLEVWILVGVIYTVLVLPATLVAKWIERWARQGRGFNANVTGGL